MKDLFILILYSANFLIGNIILNQPSIFDLYWIFATKVAVVII